MRNLKKDAMEMATKKKKILETSLQLFSGHTIDAITMNNVADACGIGVATLYRYYKTKSSLVLAVATWIWNDYAVRNSHLLDEIKKRDLSAVQQYDFFLNTFIEMYRSQKDMLRFNQLFNIYVRSERMPADEMAAYKNMINHLAERFYEIVIAGQKEGTFRRDVSPQTVFSASMHVMLAVTTRYAFGLLCTPESDVEEERELLLLKQMLMLEFTVKPKCNFSPQMIENPPQKVG